MAIQFGNIDRELADRQNVIKEDAARQYRGSRDMMQSVTDLGDTISREVKEYKANQRADQRPGYAGPGTTSRRSPRRSRGVFANPTKAPAGVSNHRPGPRHRYQESSPACAAVIH